MKYERDARMVKRAQALLWLNEGEKITVIPATVETTDGIQLARLACPSRAIETGWRIVLFLDRGSPHKGACVWHLSWALKRGGYLLPVRS